MSDAGADPKSIRNLFVISTAALPGWWGKWCPSLGTAAESLLLAGLCRCCLGEQHKDKPREGSGLGDCLTSLPARHFCSSCIQILAWLLPLSFLRRLSVSTPPDLLNPNFCHYCIALGLLALGSSLVDHKLVTLCCDVSWWFPLLWMLNQIPMQLLPDEDVTGLVFAADGNVLELWSLSDSSWCLGSWWNAKCLVCSVQPALPLGKKGVCCKKKGYSGIGWLVMRAQSIKAETVCAGFWNHWRI